MSTQVETATLYALDVAFSSDTTAFDSNRPIVMAYGFVHRTGRGEWISDGQGKETMLVGSEVYFSIFDTAEQTAEPAPSLTGITITFSQKGSPFTWSTLSIPPDAPLPQPQSTDWSAGCNVKGRFWRVGPYKTVCVTPPEVGGYECTVQITLKGADGKIKKFRVDPEMIITGNF